MEQGQDRSNQDAESRLGTARGLPTIVVGVDGSECARAALAFAAEEALLRDAQLRVVGAWELPRNLMLIAGLGRVVDQPEFDTFREIARRNVDEAVAEVRRLRPSLPAQGVVLEANPAESLLEEARAAELLVVGHRGRSGFVSLLLGSVSQQVVHHAPCPVVVVRRRKSWLRPKPRHGLQPRDVPPKE